MEGKKQQKEEISMFQKHCMLASKSGYFTMFNVNISSRSANILLNWLFDSGYHVEKLSETKFWQYFNAPNLMTCFHLLSDENFSKMMDALEEVEGVRRKKQA